MTGPDGSEGVDLYLAPEVFHEAFAADVDPETAAVWPRTAALRRRRVRSDAVGPTGVETLPCWYLLGTEDKAIPPALQRLHGRTAETRPSGGPGFALPFVSQPEAATQARHLQAVEATAVAG